MKNKKVSSATVHSATVHSATVHSATVHHFSPNDFVYKKNAVDTFLYHGKQTAGLVLNEERRAQFFQEHPMLEPLLKREKNNPLLEEGKIKEDSRDRKGEFYLTHEAITLLVEKKIIQHRSIKSGLSYNKKNIFIIKNDTDKLKNILRKLNLKNDEDAKFIYIEGIHVISFYIRKENNKIKCFIMDPEPIYGPPIEVINSLEAAFGDPCIVSSQTQLQKDFYSCSTFGIKAIMYFAKHGSEIFPQIENTITLTVGQHLLPASALMPTLLKMSQSYLDEQLTATTLDAIVSQKKKKSLRQYFSAHRKILDTTVFNTAALEKKYNYFSELDSYIQLQTAGAVIIEDNEQKLPDNLIKIHKKFSLIPAGVSKVQLHSALIGLFGSKHYAGATEEVISNAMEKIKCEYECTRHANTFQEGFKRVCTEYFPKASESLDSKTRIRDLRLAFACLEETDFDDAKKEVETLHRFFGNYANVARYLKRYGGNPNDPFSINVLCSIQWPTDLQKERDLKGWDKEAWIKLILSHQSAIPYLSQARALEKEFRDHPEKYGLLKSINPPAHSLTLERVKAARRRLAYKQADAFPRLADLCLQFKQPETVFEQCLAFQRKESDGLPSITLEGSTIGCPGFTMTKLPAGDIRGFFLGNFTHCCQNIASKTVVVDGMTEAHSGFYIIANKQGEIVAQSWAWIGQRGEFVFDSFKRKDERYDFLCYPFYEAAAKLIMAAGFSEVRLGEGGNTPQNLLFPGKSKVILKPAKHPVKGMYTDAQRQYVIYTLDTQDYGIYIEQIKIYAQHCYALPEDHWLKQLVQFNQSPLASCCDPQVLLTDVKTIITNLPSNLQSWVLFLKAPDRTSVWLSAIENNRIDLINYYLLLCSPSEQRRLILDQTNHQTALNLAQQHPDSTILDTLLQQIPMNKMVWESLDGNTPNSSVVIDSYNQWFGAIKNGNVDEAEQLLTRYPWIQITAGNLNNLSALHIASLSGHLNIVQWLITQKEINPEEKAGGFTPWQLAEYAKQTVVASWLKTQGVVTPKIDKEDTLLHIFVRLGDLPMVKELIENQSFSIESKGRYYTPLHVAVVSKREAIVRYLLERGANIGAETDCTVVSVLAYAVISRNLTILKLLFDHLPKTKSKALIADLKSAVRYSTYGHIGVDVFDFFTKSLQQLEQWQEITRDFIMDLFVNNICYFYSQDNHRYIDYLLAHYEQYIDINACIPIGKSSRNDYDEQNALSTAVNDLNLSLVKKLINLGADAHQTFRDSQCGNEYRTNFHRHFTQQSLLHIIASSGSIVGWGRDKRIAESIDMLRYLVGERGVEVNARDSNGNTVLHYAAHYLKPEMIKILLEYGADPFIKNKNDQNALDFLNKEGHSDVSNNNGLSVFLHRTRSVLKKAIKQKTAAVDEMSQIPQISNSKISSVSQFFHRRGQLSERNANQQQNETANTHALCNPCTLL